MEINLQQVQEFITTNGENQEVQSYLNGFRKEPSLDDFKSKAESDENFKSYINSLKDSHFSRSLETWKANNLNKLVEAEMLKKNPKLTPEQLEIQDLKQKFADMEKAKARAEQMAKYKDVLSEKKIPSKMVDFLLNDDETVTEANISLFEESMKSYIDEAIKAKFDGNVHIPSDKFDLSGGLITQAEWDKNKNDLNWYEKNKKQIFESKRQGLINN